ncbi:hypothetical protein FRC05_001613 [Tulasnella sp. 425]|nr:hypothetical protein FRC05_001613 [Tulasnella sp. 425]
MPQPPPQFPAHGKQWHLYVKTEKPNSNELLRAGGVMAERHFDQTRVSGEEHLPPRDRSYTVHQTTIPVSPEQAIKMHTESEQVVDKPAQLQNGAILGLPTELLLRVVSLLSTGSIRNLMVNRSFRPVCEQGLYRSISLPWHPRRSIRLLETFLLRPDLALLVRHLEIDLSWLHLSDQIPPDLQPDGLEALRLAKNIHSLCLEGVPDWIWVPEMAKFREVIFKMKLVRLQVPELRDPHTRYSCAWPGEVISDDEWDGDQRQRTSTLPKVSLVSPRETNGDLGDRIRRLLQTQPQLEEFELSDSSITDKTAASLQASLKASDVPNLKSLQADPIVAQAFLPVAARLKSLNLTIDNWGDQLLSEMESKSTAIKLSIRRFTIRVWYSDEWLWNNLAKVFALFPKTEELSVAINSQTTGTDVEPAKYFFEKVGNNVYVLPSLRRLEVMFETLSNRETPEIFEVEIGSMLEAKAACPMLETVVDPEQRLWTFRPDHGMLGGFAPYLVGPLIAERRGPVYDLPSPQGSDS